MLYEAASKYNVYECRDLADDIKTAKQTSKKERIEAVSVLKSIYKKNAGKQA